jgi:hypothetical protein
MKNIGKKVWFSSAGRSIVFGTVTEEKIENQWHLVRVDWHIPEGRASDLTEWQKIANLGDVVQLEKDLAGFRDTG